MSKIKGKRIFHGPVTICGIGWHLADWQRKQGVLSDCIVYEDQGLRQLYHIKIKTSDYGFFRRLFLKIAFFIFCAVRYDIFHFYFAKTFLPFNLDLPLLKLLRKKIVMTYCGSDIRLINVEKTRNAYAYLLRIGLDHPRFDRRKMLKMRWQNVWVNVFIAPRNLYDHARKAIPKEKIKCRPWIHNIGFDSSKIPLEKNITTNIVPQIIHAPSEKGIKGTIYVNEAIEELKRRGLKFVYRELHGVPNEQVEKYIQRADIVIDQFLIGGIGTLAFEGMGLGKPVVGYVLDSVVKNHMPDCPVFNANIDNLADRLEILIKDPELRLELGRKGIRFCAANLDYEKVQQEMLSIYEELFV